MSQILLGVMSMPDDMFWADDPITRFQHNSIRLQAAKIIESLQHPASLKTLAGTLSERIDGVNAEVISDTAWELAKTLHEEFLILNKTETISAVLP